jgi:cytochrome P450/NADPH-cytochrome P450 reductase
MFKVTFSAGVLTMVQSQLQEIPVGSFKDIHPETAMHDIVRQAHIYGPIFQLTPPIGRRRIILSSYELINEVCNDTLFDKQASALGGGTLRETAGDGLFTAETSDPNWRKAHAILMPSFGPQAMKQYFPMMVDTAEQLIEKWSRLNPEDEIDVGDDMSRVTLETIGLCGFSYRFNSFARQEPHPFVQSMLRNLSSARTRAGRLPIENRLHIRERRQHQADIDLMYSTVDHIIKERKAAGEETRKIPDMLNAMLAGVDKQTGEKLDDVNIRYQVLTFLIAGHETTSGLLSFTLFFLLHHPEVLAKAYEEVDRVLGKDLSKPPTYEQIHQLPYIAQILNESLRLCPPAPGFIRHAYEDRLLAGKYPIKAEDSLQILTVMLHRDRSVWGEDAEIFNPERHFSPEAVQARPANAFLPFGSGQRSCIGRPFALLEAPLILAMILQRFLPYSTRIYQLKIREALTIKPEDFFIKVKPRKEVDFLLSAPSSGSKIEAGTMVKEAPSQEEQIPSVEEQKLKQTSLLVLYGSNGGTAEELANRIAADGKDKGLITSSGTLDEYADKLPREGGVVIVTSTYNGTPPDNARAFCQWLQSGLAPNSLKGVNYAVFGCGNREWAATYQAIPTMIDATLEQYGARRICQRGAGDASGDFDGQFESWYRNLWRTAAQALALDSTRVTQEKPQTALYAVEIVQHPHPFPFVESFGAMPMTILENRELAISKAKGDLLPERSIRHMQIALPADITYRTGDHLGVLASNEEAQVRRIAAHFRFDPQTIIQIHTMNGRKPIVPIDEPIAVIDLLTNYFELQDVATRSHIKRMAAYTGNEAERQHLLSLAGDGEESAAMYQAEVLEKRKSVIDLLEEISSCALPFNIYLEFLTPLRPRYYSISSSPLVNASECSITVGIVKGPARSGHGIYEGVCSNYLYEQRPGEMLYAFVQDTNSPFHLPENDEIPIIMIGPGTGIAPFRGFLQERAMRQKMGKKIGKSILFFGCRHPEKDYLYQEELESFERDGVTKLYTVFSRLDPQQKVYVQDSILEHKDEVWQLLQAGAIVYICGDTTRMAPDVQKAFIQLYQEQTHKSEQEARQWLDDLQAKQRYLVDIWGI